MRRPTVEIDPLCQIEIARFGTSLAFGRFLGDVRGKFKQLAAAYENQKRGTSLPKKGRPKCPSPVRLLFFNACLVLAICAVMHSLIEKANDGA